MLSPENENEEFEFYLKFAKPLVLNLPDTSDRIKAATWIRYLKNDTTDSVLRGEYLKLLLFVLQRRKLFGPFASIPDENEPLEKFPNDINIQDVAKNFVEIDKKILKASLERRGFGEWSPYTTACSSDLTEYASSQEIPNFGIHAYYAISRDPLQQWNHFEKAIFPIGEDFDSTQPDSSVIDTVSPDISCFLSPDHSEPVLSEYTRPVPRISPGGPKDITPPEGLEDVSPKTPKPPSSTGDEFNMDPRIPPVWGSNFVNVKDSSSPTTRQSPIKDLNVEVSDQSMLDFFNDDIDVFEAFLDESSSYIKENTSMSLGSGTTPEYGTPLESGLYQKIDIDDLSDSISKYVDDDMRVIDAKLPATIPQRSPSPKRPYEIKHGASSSMQNSFTTRCPVQPISRCPSQPKPMARSPSHPRPITRSPAQSRQMVRQSPGQLYDTIEQTASGKGQSCPGQSNPVRPVSCPVSSVKRRLSSPSTIFDDKDTLEFFNDLLKLKIKMKCSDNAEKGEKKKQVKEVVGTVQEILEEINQPTTSILKTTGDLIQETIMYKSSKISFNNSDEDDYCWINDISGGNGLPQDEDWNSTGCWTDDSDESFTYCPT